MKKINLIVFCCIIVMHFLFYLHSGVILQVIASVIKKKLKNQFCQNEKAGFWKIEFCWRERVRWSISYLSSSRVASNPIKAWFAPRSQRSRWIEDSARVPWGEMCETSGSEATTVSPESDPRASARSITPGVHHHGVPPFSFEPRQGSSVGGTPVLTFAITHDAVISPQISTSAQE